MENILLILFFILCLSLVLTLVQKGKYARWAVFFRIFSIVVGFSIFTYLFIIKSIDKYFQDATAIQVINELPQALDFYVIIPEKSAEKTKYSIEHLGIIRADHYRLNYLRLDNAHQYWIIGYLGKNVSYFTQHFVPNKNIDQVISINNYKIEDEELLENAKNNIENYKKIYMDMAFWITMNLLFLVLNLGTFIKIKSKH